MRQALQAWYDQWLNDHQSTNLIYANPAKPQLGQVHFVRDTLAALLWADTFYGDLPREPPPRTDCQLTAWVIGEHRSKSVRLPVYSLERPDKGIRFVLRDNYHDWKVSVISDRPIVSPLFEYLFHTTPPIEPDYTGNELSPVYFEGFPDDLIFGYHSENPNRWSASTSERGVYTIVFEVMRQLGVLKPRTWHTRESHRAKLDAEKAAFDRMWAAEKAAKAGT